MLIEEFRRKKKLLDGAAVWNISHLNRFQWKYTMSRASKERGKVSATSWIPLRSDDDGEFCGMKWENEPSEPKTFESNKLWDVLNIWASTWTNVKILWQEIYLHKTTDALDT